ncbi:MAG TPA: TadE family protein [Parasulfuritortus sp.]
MKVNRIGVQRGAAIVEFGLVAFIFFLVMWGILEFGRDFYVRNSTQHLTRCIARKAVVTAPSQSASAIRACMLPPGGNGTFWPFYQLTAADMTGLFSIDYFCGDSNGQTNTACDPVTPPDDQVTACAGPSSPTCVKFVQVCAHGDLEQLGLLGALMKNTRIIHEPNSCTTMPAESMGVENP